MTASQLARLVNARPVKRNKLWRGRCPVHDGNSLEISVGSRTPVMIRCWGGCDNRDILAALGLTWGDILGDRPTDKETLRKILEAERKREQAERVNRAAARQTLHQARLWATVGYWLAWAMHESGADVAQMYHYAVETQRLWEQALGAAVANKHHGLKREDRNTVGAEIWGVLSGICGNEIRKHNQQRRDWATDFPQGVVRARTPSTIC